MLAALGAAGCGEGVAERSARAAGPAPGISLDNPEFLDAAERTRELQEAAALGVEWIRFDVKWSEVQRDGPDAWAWAPYDALVDEAVAGDLEILVNLSYSPPWARPEGASDKHGPDTAERREAFARFVGEAVGRYGDRVRFWEVWNEPNTETFWSPAPDPSAYAELLRAAYAAAKEADRNAVVVAGATAPVDTWDGYLDEVDFLRGVYAAGAQGHFDAWAHHPYDFERLPGTPHERSGWWQMYGAEPSIRSLMEEHGDGEKRLWATEHGVPSALYGSLDETAQAEHLRRAYAIWREQDWTGPIFNYLVRDRPSPGNEPHWGTLGLLRDDGTPKPASEEPARLAESRR